jgi:hypothetical protein
MISQSRKVEKDKSGMHIKSIDFSRKRHNINKRNHLTNIFTDLKNNFPLRNIGATLDTNNRVIRNVYNSYDDNSSASGWVVHVYFRVMMYLGWQVRRRTYIGIKGIKYFTELKLLNQGKIPPITSTNKL